MQEKLIFVISAPRSGSTLLQRMLGSHSDVMTHPEPHLITPLAYLGYYDRVDKAPYDHINAAEALRSFVDGLPQKENDYLDALRAYSDTLYGRMLQTSGKARFLDKTPAYALVYSFLSKLYPRAKYIVLTRHPIAIFSSYAHSFFEGDWSTAHTFNPIVERYVPAIAGMLRDRPVALHHVTYEGLVDDPQKTMAQMFDFLQLPPQSNVVNYGEHYKGKRGMGDPISVERLGKPVKTLKDMWAKELAADSQKLQLAKAMVQRLAERDLETWGYPVADFWRDLEQEISESGESFSKPRRLNSYVLQRRIMLALKRDIHQRKHGEWLKKVRYYCDVLLRDA